MASPVVTGRGPGEGYVTTVWIVIIVILLVVLAVIFMAGLVWLWPSCEVSSDTTRSTTTLTVTSITPGSGKISGGDVVIIRGTGFTEGATVSFGDQVAADVQVLNPTYLTAHSPKHDGGRVNIAVSNPDKQKYTLAGGFIYVDPQVPLTRPSISSLTPASGPLTGGQSVTITGTGFLNVTTVSFGSLPGTNLQVLNDTTLSATTPAHAEGKVDVVVGDGSTATLSGGYTYTCWGSMPYRLLLMVILAGALGGTLHGVRSLWWYVGNRDLRQSWLLMYVLLPVSGAAIAVIFFLVVYAGLYTVQGTGSFILVGLAALVGMFSSQAAEKLKMIAEGLLMPAPQGANTVAPQQTREAAQSAALTVTSIVPSSGTTAGNQPVTISGTGFSGGITVTFGGVNATNVQAVNDTTITANTPRADAAGPVDVVTRVGTASMTLHDGYTYTT
jgi:hypothetical protein